MAKPNPKDFMLMDRKGEKVTRDPGSLRGYDFVIDGCEHCEIRLLDRTAQVQVDYCKDCKILIGPVGGSIFARNCERCVIFAACQQLRTRECVDCDIILLIPGHPIIETSHNIRFGALPRDVYGEFETQMKEANLTVTKNHWDNIYDFSPDNPAGCTHFTILSSDATAKAIASFPARPSAETVTPKAEVPGAKTSAVGEDTDIREVRVTGKRGAQFHANLCRAYLCGRPAEEDRPALAASLRVVLSGAGGAVGTAIHAATILERDGVARVSSVSTGLADLGDGHTERPDGNGGRHVPVARIVLERLAGIASS